MDGWKNKSFKAYADYMITTSFKEGIDEMLSLMENYGNLVVMCSEVVPWRCHRRMIADYLTMIEGISVFDIIDNKQQPNTTEYSVQLEIPTHQTLEFRL
ncbi:MAG: DUF488 domain-containing protein [Candidatus Nitrosopolaris sp.]